MNMCEAFEAATPTDYGDSEYHYSFEEYLESEEYLKDE